MMIEAKRIPSFSPNGVSETPRPPGNNNLNGAIQEQDALITRVTEEMLFAASVGFAWSPFGRSLQGISSKRSSLRDQEPGSAKGRELEAEIQQACREINIDPSDLDSIEQQRDGIVQQREEMTRIGWEIAKLAGDQPTTDEVLTEA